VPYLGREGGDKKQAIGNHYAVSKNKAEGHKKNLLDPGDWGGG